MSNPELITAVDLDQWSGTLAAQTTLPILVRRLILATTPVTEITVRAREGALLPGWDGIVRSDVADTHVPPGTSGWELGTSKDPRAKPGLLADHEDHAEPVPRRRQACPRRA